MFARSNAKKRKAPQAEFVPFRHYVQRTASLSSAAEDTALQRKLAARRRQQSSIFQARQVQVARRERSTNPLFHEQSTLWYQQCMPRTVEDMVCLVTDAARKQVKWQLKALCLRMLQHCDKPSTPRTILLQGTVGCGKSTLVRCLPSLIQKPKVSLVWLTAAIRHVNAQTNKHGTREQRLRDAMAALFCVEGASPTTVYVLDEVESLSVSEWRAFVAVAVTRRRENEGPLVVVCATPLPPHVARLFLQGSRRAKTLTLPTPSPAMVRAVVSKAVSKYLTSEQRKRQDDWSWCQNVDDLRAALIRAHWMSIEPVKLPSTDKKAIHDTSTPESVLMPTRRVPPWDVISMLGHHADLPRRSRDAIAQCAAGDLLFELSCCGVPHALCPGDGATLTVADAPKLFDTISELDTIPMWQGPGLSITTPIIVDMCRTLLPHRHLSGDAVRQQRARRKRLRMRHRRQADRLQGYAEFIRTNGKCRPPKPPFERTQATKRCAGLGPRFLNVFASQTITMSTRL